MQFLAYVQSGAPQIDYTARDESAGVIGSLRDLPNPIGAADTREAITEIAYAHLGRRPSDTLYIADSNGLLYDIVINRQYHDERSASGKAIVVAWTCFVLTALVFFGTVLLGLGWIGLVLAAASSALYLATVHSGFLNEIEGGALCVTFVLLAVLLVPAIQRVMQTGG